MVDGINLCFANTGGGGGVGGHPATLKWGLCEYVIVHTILGGSPIILWTSLGGKPKWLPLKFGYHDVMRISPIVETGGPQISGIQIADQ